MLKRFLDWVVGKVPPEPPMLDALGSNHDWVSWYCRVFSYPKEYGLLAHETLSIVPDEPLAFDNTAAWADWAQKSFPHLNDASIASVLGTFGVERNRLSGSTEPTITRGTLEINPDWVTWFCGTYGCTRARGALEATQRSIRVGLVPTSRGRYKR